MRGSVVLFIFSACLALVLGPVGETCREGLDESLNDYLTAELIVIVALQLPGVLLIGVAMLFPMLALQGSAARFVVGLLLPLVLCASILAGFALTEEHEFSAEDWCRTMAIFLMGVLGGMVASVSAVWLLGWRLRKKGDRDLGRPFGISDLFVVTGLGAAAVAYLRHWGPLTEGSRLPQSLPILAFFVLAGFVLVLNVMFFFRLWMVPGATRLNATLLVSAILLSALMVGCWALPLFRQDTPFTSPLTALAGMSVATIVVATFVMGACCWWLRGCGFWLETAKDSVRLTPVQDEHERSSI